MNLKQVLLSYPNTQFFNTYVHVNQYFEIDDPIDIDINMDINGNVYLLPDTTITAILNVNGSVFAYENLLTPGTFISRKIFYNGINTRIREPRDHLTINGYITDKGILS